MSPSTMACALSGVFSLCAFSAAWARFESRGRGLLEFPKLLKNPTNEVLRTYTKASEWEAWRSLLW